VLRSADLIIDNKQVSFEELLHDVDLPTAIKMMIANVKR
jgi:hypothetical protein